MEVETLQKKNTQPAMYYFSAIVPTFIKKLSLDTWEFDPENIMV